MGVLAESSGVCDSVCMCVCEEGSKRVRGRLTENRKYTFVRMKRMIFSRSWRCPYSLSAFGNHTAKRGGTECAFVTSVRRRSPLPIQLCHTITFEFLPHIPFVWCTSLHNIFHALPMAKWPSSPNAADGTVTPYMASRCQNQFNSTSCGTKWPSPAVWCFLLVWNLFTIVWWMLFVLFLAGALKHQVLTVHRHNHAHTDTSWNQVFKQMPHLQLWLWHLARKKCYHFIGH